MLSKCCSQYVSQFRKLNGHRTGKGQFSLQSQRRSNANKYLNYCTVALILHIGKKERKKNKVKSLSRVCLFATSWSECSLPDFSVHGIFQARVLEWVAISFSRRSSWLRDWTWVSRIVGRRFTIWATREVHYQDFNQELPDIQAGFQEAEEAEVRLPTFVASWWEQGSSRKHLNSASLLKSLAVENS